MWDGYGDDYTVSGQNFLPPPPPFISHKNPR